MSIGGLLVDQKQNFLNLDGILNYLNHTTKVLFKKTVS